MKVISPLLVIAVALFDLCRYTVTPLKGCVTGCNGNQDQNLYRII
jgi:hypothetical protein